jgi:uncharacterized protein YbjT (DUF2867 family)
MILVTGGTGFIGQALLYHLVEDGLEVRTLLHPSNRTPRLPKGLSLDVAISNIYDERNMRTALVGVDTVFHLAGAEWKGVHADLDQVEIAGIRTLIEVGREAGVKRIIYVSHLGANRASAYPIFKIKGIVEEYLRKGGIDYTILRSGLVFGPDDNFTTQLAKLISLSPYFIPIPGEGDTFVQPIWIEDLVACLLWSLDKEDTINQTIELGGPEFLSMAEIYHEVIKAAGLRRRVFSMQPSLMRIAGVVAEYFFPILPHSVYWLDYLSANRTCDVDSITRWFGILPARFTQHLDYLRGVDWRRQVFREIFRRSRN